MTSSFVLKSAVYKFTVSAVFVFAVVSIWVPSKASATLPGPAWPGLYPLVMPAQNFTTLYHCNEVAFNPTLWSPSFTSWISLAGSPTVTTLTVPFGTPSVTLDYNINGATCISSGGSVIRTNSVITGSSPAGISGIVGQQLGLFFGAGSPVGTYASVKRTFTYAPPGGFTVSFDHIITLTGKSINQFPASPNFRCVENSSTPHTAANITDFTPCDPGNPSFLVRINVLPAVGFNLTPSVTAPAFLPNSTSPTTANFSSHVSSSATRSILNVPVTQHAYIDHIVGPNTDIASFPSNNIPVNTTIPVAGRTFTNNGIALPGGLISGDQVCLAISVPDSGTIDVSGNIVSGLLPLQSATACSTISASPYFSIFGGDVFAGANDGSVAPSNCTGWGTDNTTAGIYAFRGASNKQGSVAEAGVFALGVVDNSGNHGFSSAVLRLLNPVAPLGLTFANTGVGSPGGLGVVHCPYDYYGNMNVGAGVSLAPGNAIELNGQLNSNAGNNYSVIHSPVPTPVRVYASGNTVNSSAGGSTVINLYVNGDVLISSNIAYGNAGGWGSTAEIPRVQVVAKGNIYITNAVTQLDGIYVAQGGTIYTCATNPPALAPSPAIASNTLYGSCNNQLIVNGALVASRVKWLRSFGSTSESVIGEKSTSGASNTCHSAGAVITAPICAAEVVNFSPETFLITPPPPQNVNTFYDSITALPPLL